MGGDKRGFRLNDEGIESSPLSSRTFLTTNQFPGSYQWLYISSIIYIPASYFTKTAILLTVVRVFSIKRGVARGIHIYLFAVLAAYTPVQVVKIIICNPIMSYWDPCIEGRCFDQPRIFIVDTAFAIASDLVILIVPIPLTWSLQMTFWKKVKIIATLGFGGVAMSIAVFREYKVVKLIESTDFTVDFVPLPISG
jgi:hypothetical protein